ncbi:MAG: putative ABC transport system ATP-binding protein [Cellvibrionaceae bacterium]|jgi:putative ABC transport system ATP-binding protein
MTEKPIIAIKDLIFSWPIKQSIGSKKTNAIKPILDIPNWEIQPGQSIFLYGRSGSGKSTLLNLISGILQPQQGTITINEQTISDIKPSQRDRFRAQNLGIIFQQFNLIPYLSVTDNIRLSQAFSGTEYDHQRLLELTKKLGLSENILQQKANQLSVGQQQRVAVIRALYHRPKLIIADEPTSALDAETRDEFIQLLLEQNNEKNTEKNKKENSSILFVSHDRSLASNFDQQIDINELNKARG